jgi:Ca2+-binding RTX toxin-like protein
MLVRSPSSPDAFVTARVYNNVVADVFDLGILLEAGPRLAVLGDRNNIVTVPGGNDFGSYPMGTTLDKEPRFKSQGSGNYRLSPASRLANAAASCPLGGVLPRGDAGGRFRYFGPALDLGAYERGSTARGSARSVSRTGSNAPNLLVGTRGRDVLCGLAGNDRLVGRGGPDFLIGGLGRDRVLGGSGNDRIDLRDGVSGNDRGDGGPGQDVCMRDAGDRRTSC